MILHSVHTRLFSIREAGCLCWCLPASGSRYWFEGRPSRSAQYGAGCQYPASRIHGANNPKVVPREQCKGKLIAKFKCSRRLSLSLSLFFLFLENPKRKKNMPVLYLHHFLTTTLTNTHTYNYNTMLMLIRV
jgi:hypothetical protein